MSEGTWEKLSQVAVKGAEHDSRERQPHPKCLKGTRVAVLAHIYELLDKKDENKIIWLHGIAGVGKSAVAFTVAERMKGLKMTEETKIETRLAGTFFFSRKHTKRRTTGYFFATLAYQLAINFPSIRKDVNRAILNNPALLDPDKSLHDQMEALFLQPLRKLQIRLCGCPPLSFIVDALDECTPESPDQCTLESFDEDKSKSELVDLISLLAQALRDPDLPVTHILVTSRLESHIHEAMQNEDVWPLVCEIPVKIFGQGVATTISLDGTDVDEDIYLFLKHSLEKLASTNDKFPQPSTDQLARLASRAGRRFIVASTMMKFIDDKHNDPHDRLQLMLELSNELLPGTEVYKLYDHILSTCASPSLAYLHLSIVCALADPLPISEISTLLGPSQGRDVKKVLQQLRSVIDIPSNENLPVNICHSSVRDYTSHRSNCALHQVQYIASPHSLLAVSSLRLMIRDIPDCPGLLDALSALKRHSQAMEPHDPQSLTHSLSFMVQPPEPMHALITLLWLRGNRSSALQFWLETQNGHAWLETNEGKAWLQTQGGKDWLQIQGVHVWLQTQGGRHWLQTQDGKDWLQTQGGTNWLHDQDGKDWLWTQGGQVWLQTQGGRVWLQTQNGQVWLRTQDGRDWLHAQNVKDWLQARGRGDWLQTQDGKDWLQTQRGEVWLWTQGGRDWLQARGGQDWLRTQDGKDWLQTQGGDVWLQTQGGRDWLQTQGGEGWLRTQGGRDWLQTQDGKYWLQAQGGRDWLQTQDGKYWLQAQDGKYWLQTQDGKDWLQTQDGKDWLQTEDGQDWLQTEIGKDWLQTEDGQDWLQTQHGQDWLQIQNMKDWLQARGRRVWLLTQGGQDWLHTQEGNGWLQTQSGDVWLQTQGGRDWLQTQDGKDWLQTQNIKDWLQAKGRQVWLQTQGGRDWLQSQDGKFWLQTQSGEVWLQTESGEVWLQTQGGRDWLQTADGKDWLQTQSGQDWLSTQGRRDWLRTQANQDWPETNFRRAWQPASIPTWSQFDDVSEDEGWLEPWMRPRPSLLLVVTRRHTLHSTTGGGNWSQALDRMDWVQTEDGKDWLQTQGGRDWLQTQDGKDWLQTLGGRNWLQTQHGRDWLQTQGGRDWLRTQDGKDWLQTQDGKDWLQTHDGKGWLQTQGGRNWLHTQGGRDWLQTNGGRDWLQTPYGQAWSSRSIWGTMEEFLNTWEAISGYTMTPGLSLPPAFQVIQLFKTLPDFLMFPAFLALRHQYHSFVIPQGRSPHTEVICAIKAFLSFSYCKGCVEFERELFG